MQASPSPTAPIPPTSVPPMVPVRLQVGERTLPVTPVGREMVSQEGGGLTWRWRVPRHQVGFHNNSAALGTGTTVLVGHSWWYGEAETLSELEKQPIGAELVATGSDGREHRYRIVERLDFPYGVDGSLWVEDERAAGTNQLLVYTCNEALEGLVLVRALPLPGIGDQEQPDLNKEGFYDYQ